MRSIDELHKDEARKIRFVLMDIDDTLTTGGRLTAESYAALWELKESGLRVIPVTGRPAGWCDLIAREWPVDGVVGENGAFAFLETEGRRLEVLTHPKAIRNDDPRTARALERSLREVPGTRLARDQSYRLYDIAIDFAEEEPVLPLSEATRIAAICTEEGLHAKVSSIHVNAWAGNYDKRSMALRFLEQRFGYDDGQDRDTVVFVGDSPNDEPMFEYFPLACGVANVVGYGPMIRHQPAFVATKECGAGFAQIAKAILGARG
jgi:HAD superfamily hydrolase (TIGR01484 family)